MTITNDDKSPGLETAKKATGAVNQVANMAQTAAKGAAGKAIGAGAGKLGLGLGAQHAALGAGAAGGAYMGGKSLAVGAGAGLAGWFPMLMAACIGTAAYFVLRGRHARKKHDR
ncbi:hypothetical protein [Magnetospira sp. QH-2]|uniref:hypothetical protein n=1 Tax=Magnetospira sp. (strain QH-2) TaxID=1288970 RepID=UPI0003E80A31|nr:hypothetical protein [Magnetospira sp. QH-2]CCQ74725.1 putative magnetosome protein Mms6 like protein [Magnetospira sp. QH-2]